MKWKFFALSAILASSVLAFAQGSGSTAPQRSEPTRNVVWADDFRVTRSFEGKISELKTEDKVVVIEGKNGRRQSLHFSDDTKIRFAKKRSSDSSVKLTDMKPGERVKAVFRPSDSHAVEIKLMD
jgi:hypothetical protein